MNGKELAVEQNGNTVRDALDLGEDVGGDEDRKLLRERADQSAHLDDLARVETIGRLVQHQQLRLSEQRLSDSHALPIAARELSYEQGPHALQGQALDHLIDGRRQRCTVEPANAAHEFEELGHPHVGVKRDVFRHVPQLAASLESLRYHVETGDCGGTRGRTQVPG